MQIMLKNYLHGLHTNICVGFSGSHILLGTYRCGADFTLLEVRVGVVLRINLEDAPSFISGISIAFTIK